MGQWKDEVRKGSGEKDEQEAWSTGDGRWREAKEVG